MVMQVFSKGGLNVNSYIYLFQGEQSDLSNI